MCGCEHVNAANASHCLQSVEHFHSALEEGFGHFMATRTFNRAATPNQCSFTYYKEVLGADLLGAIDCTSAAPGVCAPFTQRNGTLRQVALPPLGIDCSNPLPLRDTFCPTPLTQAGSNTPPIGALVTEHDMLQFLWSIHTKGTAPSTLDDILSVFLSLCSEAVCEVENPHARCAACTGSEDIVWTNGVPSQRSLVEWAEEYFNARYGENSTQLSNFRTQASTHGITPETVQ